MIGTLVPHRRTLVWAAGIATAATLAVSGAAVAQGSGGSVSAPPAVPTSASQIQNIDQVKTAIKGYYGDTLTMTPDPVDGTTMLHATSPKSPYAKEMAGLVVEAKGYLQRKSPKSKQHSPKAIVLDIDDTTLNTYNYEIYSNFVYNPTSNAAFVNGAAFPAVFHMPSLVSFAKREGYTILFLTGRPGTQRDGTVTNLTKAGYPSVPTKHLVLKDYTADKWLSSCAPTCTTIQYKSLTRQHFEKDLGYNIVANFGDQYSDLTGGYADKSFKLPNPMYYLP